MRKIRCDYRCLLLIAAVVAFFYIQMRLFATQSEYSDRLAAALESENHCTSQSRLLIDQISIHQSNIVSLQEQNRRQAEECRQLKALLDDLERKGVRKVVDKAQVPVAAVVIMACNRADYLQRTIESILKYQSSVASKYPLFVSQDGSDPNVRSKAMSYDQLMYIQHLDSEPVQTERPGELIAYYKIARHYKWAMDQLFYKHNFSRVIILEDDMEIAPDFFDYFEAASALLEKDKSIMAVSSWNDNGQKQFVHDPCRQFIRPEVCRTYNFGEHGSSLGQFFQQYLQPIKLNNVKIDWKAKDLSYLTKDNYTKHFADIVRKAKPVHGTDAVLKAYNIEGDVRIQYRDQPDFEWIAHQFGIFEEWKDGIPRTSFKGVVVFRYHTTRRIFLVGPDSLRQLGIEDA
ncbi:alpha-1,3-mannosyl-glycoprotein 2-beta-N-acetylglucosaminyltransferase-like isoform X1 [Populus alba x Populus x berolinensis]|nr:alpha-1,3-mannosyl-glycoprotein 2-beta-N-acetylglucosaminyltransferase-like isoform X1 [Populus alba x Populus x berolinensis]